jgi:transcriptional regulator with XRE-family HTH domain
MFLRAFRKDKGFSQQKMADELGVSITIYKQWEKEGILPPKIEAGIKLAEMAGATLDQLYLGRETVTFSDSPIPQNILNQLVADLGMIYQDQELFKLVCDFISSRRYEVLK